MGVGVGEEEQGGQSEWYIVSNRDLEERREDTGLSNFGFSPGEMGNHWRIPRE